jgi:hypothetical protein
VPKLVVFWARLGGWKLIALANTLGMVWAHPTDDERIQTFLRYEYQSRRAPAPRHEIYSCPHDSLRFLAWQVEGELRPRSREHRQLLRRAVVSCGRGARDDSCNTNECAFSASLQDSLAAARV